MASRLITVVLAALFAFMGASIAGQAVFWHAHEGVGPSDVAQLPTPTGQSPRAEIVPHVAYLPSHAHVQPAWVQVLVGGKKWFPPHATIDPTSLVQGEASVADAYKAAGWEYSSNGRGYEAQKGDLTVALVEGYPYNKTLMVRGDRVWWHVGAWGVPVLVAAVFGAWACRRRWQWDSWVLVLLGVCVVPQVLITASNVAFAAPRGVLAQADAFFPALLMASGFALVPRLGLVAVAVRLVWLRWPRVRRRLVAALAAAPLVTGLIALVRALVIDWIHQRLNPHSATDITLPVRNIDDVYGRGPFGPLVEIFWGPGQFLYGLFAVVGAFVAVVVAPSAGFRRRKWFALLALVGTAFWLVLFDYYPV